MVTATIATPEPFPFSPSALDITRLYRAHVSAADWRGTEVTAFVQAANHNAAVRKIAAAIAVLEYRKPEEVIERIYNCTSATELIEENLSEDDGLRLFETGWQGCRPVSWVESPLVLLTNPGPLLAVWARIPRTTTEGAP
jgi:hypothetical protein